MNSNTPGFPELPEVARIESSQGARPELDMYVTSITNNTPAPLQGAQFERLMDTHLLGYNQEVQRISLAIQDKLLVGENVEDLIAQRCILWAKTEALHLIKEEYWETHTLQDVEPVTSQVGVNAAGDAVHMSIGTEEEETEGQYAVRFCALGMSINFEMPTPEDALNLYNALLKVKEVEAD